MGGILALERAVGYFVAIRFFSHGLKCDLAGLNLLFFMVFEKMGEQSRIRWSCLAYSKSMMSSSFLRKVLRSAKKMR